MKRNAWQRSPGQVSRLAGQAGMERRARVLARFPLCAQCHTRRSTIADHIVNLAAGGDDSEANMQGLCKPCHDAKTQVEAAQGVLRRAMEQQASSGTRPQWRVG